MKHNILWRRMATVALIVVLYTATAWSQNDGRRRAITILPDIDVSACDGTSGGDCNPAYLYLYGSRVKAETKRNRVIYMHFSLEAVPAGAIVDSVYVKLYLKQPNDEETFQQAKLYELRNQDTTLWKSITWGRQPSPGASISGRTIISGAEVSPDHIGQSADFVIEGTDGTTWLTNRAGNLWFFLAANSRQYAYYSSRSGDPSKQPKLVIEYHMPYQLQVSNWSQYKCNAQHTGQYEWSSNVAATEYKTQFVYQCQGTSYNASDPIVCNGMLVFHHQSFRDPLHSIKAITESGRVVSEIAEYGVSQQQVADRHNNIYYLKGGNRDTLRMLRFTDNTLSVAYTKPLHERAFGDEFSIPAIGFDGSIYITTDKGIYAYTPLPEFKIKWKYPLQNDSRYGTVTLSEDEKMLYLYDKKGRLVALDNIQGTVVWEKPVNRKTGDHAPVISAKKNRVFTIDGFRSGGYFYMFDATTGGEIVKETGPAKSFSQPVADDNYAYLISGGTLKSYKLTDGAAGTPAVTTSSPLNPASTLALDKKGNIFILSTEDNNQFLTGIFTTGEVARKRITEVGNLTGNSMVMSPTGKLIIRSDNGIYALYPAHFSGTEHMEIPDNKRFASESLYRANGNIGVAWVPAEIKPAQTVVIQSGYGKVIFRNNFKVKLGSQLSVKTGYSTTAR